MGTASDRIKLWRENPRQFVLDVFQATPDQWQIEALEMLGKPGLKRVALKACAGPGKTCILAWEGWRRLLCYAGKGEHPKGIAISCTADNLSANLWTEMAKWQARSPLLMAAFEWTKTRIYAKDHPETWFLSARAYPQSADPEQCARTLSGLHSDYPFYLVDESGDMPPAISRAAEQGLTTAKDGLILTAGNTTSHEGLLYDVAVRRRDLWGVITITADPDDPRRTPRVSMDWAREQIAEHGRDNPWVQAYILGEFPAGSINALLTVEDVEAAMRRTLRARDIEHSQKRIGLDVARFGDDRTVIFPRQGQIAMMPVVLRHQDVFPVAARTLEAHQKWQSDNIFVDGTGGWGVGVVAALRDAGAPVIEVQFAGRPTDPRYLNMRAQMWFRLAEWVRGGGCLPNVPELVRELTSPTYSYSHGKFALEPKENIKKRTGRSPDLGDALALTLAWDDAPIRRSGDPVPGIIQRGCRPSSDYDPLDTNW